MSTTVDERELRALKLEYRRLYGTSAKGKKRNDVEFLKARIQEKKEEIIDTDVSDSEDESQEITIVKPPVKPTPVKAPSPVETKVVEEPTKKRKRIDDDANKPKTPRILPNDVIDHINALYQYHADTMLDLVEQVVKASHDEK